MISKPMAILATPLAHTCPFSCLYLFFVILPRFAWPRCRLFDDPCLTDAELDATIMNEFVIDPWSCCRSLVDLHWYAVFPLWDDCGTSVVMYQIQHITNRTRFLHWMWGRRGSREDRYFSDWVHIDICQKHQGSHRVEYRRTWYQRIETGQMSTKSWLKVPK